MFVEALESVSDQIYEKWIAKMKVILNVSDITLYNTFLSIGEWDMAWLRAGSDQLPEQVPTDPRLGWTLHQG